MYGNANWHRSFAFEDHISFPSPASAAEPGVRERKGNHFPVMCRGYRASSRNPDGPGPLVRPSVAVQLGAETEIHCNGTLHWAKMSANQGVRIPKSLRCRVLPTCVSSLPPGSALSTSWWFSSNCVPKHEICAHMSLPRKNASQHAVVEESRSS